MHTTIKFLALPAALGLALASTMAFSAEAPSTAPTDAAPMMGHSPAEGKAMRKMNDQPTAPHFKSKKKPRKQETHMMMDHSPADAKGMRNMKEKEIPLHREGDPAPKGNSQTHDHMMMDHSPADAKGMRNMKSKDIPIHHDEGAAEGKQVTPQP